MIAVDVWQWTPFVALILLAGMQSISPEITEAAELDGLTRFQYLWRIALPLLTPIIVVVGLIRLIDALKTFDLIYVITRGGPGTTTYKLPLHAYAMGFDVVPDGAERGGRLDGGDHRQYLYRRLPVAARQGAGMRTTSKPGESRGVGNIDQSRR